jgi:hypothetical protein
VFIDEYTILGIVSDALFIEYPISEDADIVEIVAVDIIMVDPYNLENINEFVLKVLPIRLDVIKTEPCVLEVVHEENNKLLPVMVEKNT